MFLLKNTNVFDQYDHDDNDHIDRKRSYFLTKTSNDILPVLSI